MRDDQGFTIVEVLVAAAIVALAAFGGLAACKITSGVLAWSRATGTDIDGQLLQFRTDAASARAIFVPPAAASGPGGSAEVDFATETSRGTAIFWCYVYDSVKQVVQRYDYDTNGIRGVRDVTTGAIDPAASYPPLRGITHFAARAIAADQLGDPAHSMYSGVGALFAHAPHAVDVVDAAVRNVPGAVGGNGVIEIALASQNAARVVHLAAGALPTGFTVTGLPVWHAIVYRVDQSHRFLLGVAGKSHVFINAHVDVSYDHWATKVAWCDFNLLGNPDGLDGDDPHANYTPSEPVERSDAILAACRQRHPLPPDRDSAGYPPDPDAIHPPLPGQTAPPCWTTPGPSGRCWPADAPPNWTPPAPAPLDTPPPAWCATHAAASACGGRAGTAVPSASAE